MLLTWSGTRLDCEENCGTEEEMASSHQGQEAVEQKEDGRQED